MIMYKLKNTMYVCVIQQNAPFVKVPYTGFFVGHVITRVLSNFGISFDVSLDLFSITTPGYFGLFEFLILQSVPQLILYL